MDLYKYKIDVKKKINLHLTKSVISIKGLESKNLIGK